MNIERMYYLSLIDGIINHTFIYDKHALLSKRLDEIGLRNTFNYKFYSGVIATYLKIARIFARVYNIMHPDTNVATDYIEIPVEIIPNYIEISCPFHFTFGVDYSNHPKLCDKCSVWPKCYEQNRKLNGVDKYGNE